MGELTNGQKEGFSVHLLICERIITWRGEVREKIIQFIEELKNQIHVSSGSRKAQDKILIRKEIVKWIFHLTVTNRGNNTSSVKQQFAKKRQGKKESSDRHKKDKGEREKDSREVRERGGRGDGASIG